MKEIEDGYGGKTVYEDKVDQVAQPYHTTRHQRIDSQATMVPIAERVKSVRRSNEYDNTKQG